MIDANTLKASYIGTTYQLSGHGSRRVHVLKEAFQQTDDQLVSDMYGKGAVIEDFQEKMAAILGKETAVFFPSGTMAQQIALRIWCDDKGLRRVAYHPLCHLEIHEQDGLKELHQIEAILLADRTRVIEPNDVRTMDDDVACLLLELPQREIGGQLPSYEALEEITDYCREKGIRLHLDGARLFEITPYYQKSAAEVCALFDSVYISFYKGIGGIAGAILAGEQSFTEEAKIWKRRYGGDLISLYPYILPADYYFDQRFPRMGLYYEEAIELAALINSCQNMKTQPLVPVSNMFHVHLYQSKERIEAALKEVHEETGVGITGYLMDLDEGSCAFELSLGDSYAEVPKEYVHRAIQLLDEKMK